jgi:tRNA G18 (ribose-2'-O)-methylase SpoU
MVTDRYQHVSHHEDVETLVRWAQSAGPGGGRLPLIGIDNLPGAVPLEGHVLPRECVLVFGQEGPGLSASAHEACDVVLSIAQFGSTRSINAGAAAAIAMHTWVTRHAVAPVLRRGGTPWPT